jgi:hypothetical protein
VVGVTSAWIDPDSPVAPLRRDSAAALAQELSWAAHLNLQAVVLPPPPRGTASANYAQIINKVRLQGAACRVAVVRRPFWGGATQRAQMRVESVGCLCCPVTQGFAVRTRVPECCGTYLCSACADCAGAEGLAQHCHLGTHPAGVAAHKRGRLGTPSV